MTTIETAFNNTKLKDVWPVLSLDCKRTLVEDLKRVIESLGSHWDERGVREIYRCVRANYEHDLKELEALENKLNLT